MNAKKVPLFDILFAKTEIKIQTKFVGLVQSNVFLSWYSWKIAHIRLNNN